MILFSFFAVSILACIVVCIGAYLIFRNEFWKRQDFMEKINRLFRWEIDMEDTRSFDEVFVAVKYKILNKMPMLTAKEKLVEQMIMDAVDAFGYHFIYSN